MKKQTVKEIIYFIAIACLIVLLTMFLPSCQPKMIGGIGTPNCKPYKGYKVKAVRNDRQVYLPTSKL